LHGIASVSLPGYPGRLTEAIPCKPSHARYVPNLAPVAPSTLVSQVQVPVLKSARGAGAFSASVDSMRSSRPMLVYASQAALQWRTRSLSAESSRARRTSVQQTE